MTLDDLTPGQLVRLPLLDGKRPDLYGLVHRIGTSTATVVIVWEDGRVGILTFDGSTLADGRRLEVVR